MGWTSIALRAVGVVAITVFVEVRPLGSINWEDIDYVAVAVIITVGATEHLAQRTGAGHQRTGVLAVNEPVVVVVEVLAVVFTTVSVSVIAERGREAGRTGRAEVFLNRGYNAKSDVIGQGSIANAVVVVVNVLTGVLASITVVIRGAGRGPTELPCSAGVGKVVDAVVVVVSVFNAVAAAVAVVVALRIGRPHQRALLARVVEVGHTVAVVVLVAGIAKPVRVEIKL